MALETIIELAKKIFYKVSGVVFPNKCVSCNNPDLYGFVVLCYNCWKKLEFITPPYCYKCGKAKFWQEEECCCGNLRRHYNSIRAPLVYSSITKSLIKRYKYNNNIKLHYMFSKIMWVCSKSTFYINDMIIPVPLHKDKLNYRGYNQSLLISKLLSKKSKVPCINNLLIRSLNNDSQSTLSFKQRKKNIMGAFCINEKYSNDIKNSNIILIDDVVTTGATVNECAKVLKMHGAKTVNVLSIAKT